VSVSGIDELFAQDMPLGAVLEEVARLGARLPMQAALEAEVTEFPGRDRYQRAAALRGFASWQPGDSRRD
jgi:putative transposase